MKTEDMLSQPVALPEGVDYDEYIICLLYTSDAADE